MVITTVTKADKKIKAIFFILLIFVVCQFYIVGSSLQIYCFFSDYEKVCCVRLAVMNSFCSILPAWIWQGFCCIGGYKNICYYYKSLFYP